MRAGAPLNLFTDVYYTPIIISELAQVAHELLDLNASGIFHIAGVDRISKYDFGTKLAKLFNLNTTLIRPAIFSYEKNFTQRPLDMSLSITKACKTIGRSLGGVDGHLALLVSQEQIMQEVIQQV
jgi:dTDP-4-dehydrorhamnose reductase